MKKNASASQQRLTKQWMISKIISIVGILIILVGVIVGVLTNKSSLDAVLSKDAPVKVTGTIVGYNEQIDTDTQEYGTVEEVMYHLVLNYIKDGRVQEIVLLEAYPTVEFASKYVDEERTIFVDSQQNQFVFDPIVYYFVFIILFGILLTVGSVLFRYRYSYEYGRLIPNKKN